MVAKETAMSAEDDVVKAIAKQLPVKAVYNDAVKPAAKQIGQFAEELLKTLRLALFPVTLAAGAFDRFDRFVKRSVAQVPEKKRVAPAPQILGPVLEGVRYEPEGTPIDEMFAALLSTAMDSDRLKDAHPSFPSIIKQLSSDEAKLLEAMYKAAEPPKLVQIFELRPNGIAVTRTERSELTAEGLVFPENLEMYTSRLQSLGLIQAHAERGLEPIYEGERQTGGRNFFVFKFSDFGSAFMRACSAPQNEALA